MGNYMWMARILLFVMAATPSRPGLDHVTVVPTNLDEVDEPAADDDDPN